MFNLILLEKSETKDKEELKYLVYGIYESTLYLETFYILSLQVQQR